MTRQRRRPGATPPGSPPAGVPIDRSGGFTRDPTENVLDLVQASTRRHDDLMAAQLELIESKITRLDDIMALEARHAAEMQRKESERLDAIRAVDVQAVQRAAEVAEIRASTLAGQVAAAAEANRSAVSAASASAEGKLTTALEPIQGALAELRRMQYEMAGQRTEKAEQRVVSTDTRSSNQWVIATVIGVAVVLVQLALHFMPATPPAVR